MLKSKGDMMPPYETPALIFTIPDIEKLYWHGIIGQLSTISLREIKKKEETF